MGIGGTRGKRASATKNSVAVEMGQDAREQKQCHGRQEPCRAEARHYKNLACSATLQGGTDFVDNLKFARLPLPGARDGRHTQTMRFVRKSIRLPAESYIGRRLHFVTVCTYERKPAFAEPRWVSCCQVRLRESSTAYNFAVHAYCFMPDHLHLLVEGLEDESRLNAFVSRFKQSTAFEYRRETGNALWQAKFYDYVLRKSVEMDAVAWYIWTNPVRKGLCANPGNFPHSGSMTVAWPQKPAGTVLWTPPWKTGTMPG